jgi:hypothetical protein
MNGTCSILNCTDGDTKISFDPAQPDDAARAEAVVKDMLARGYVLAVELDGKMKRVLAFDSAKCEYVVLCDPPDGEPAKRRGGRRKGVPAKTSRAYAVGATSGGGLCGRAFGVTRSELAAALREGRPR